VTSETKALSIVVVGAMNPPIHTPSWYKASKILTDEEADDPAALATLMVVPDILQFQTERFQIVCMADRWQILAAHEEDWPRILDIACRTFEILEHTPVRAFGLNIVAHLPTDARSVGARLGSAIVRAQVGFPETPSLIGNRLSAAWPGRPKNSRVTLVVEPSTRGEGLVFVSLNVTHEMRDEKRKGYFELSPLLRDGVAHARETADASFSHVVASFGTKEGGRNADSH
jgi:hypothetical protein